MLVDPNGARSDPEGPASAVELSYRLTDALRKDNRIKDAFGKALEPDGGADGLNIEGIVVVGKTLFAGLRAPNLDGEAVLVGAHLDDVFQAGNAPLSSDAVQASIKIGRGGIRDLSRLPDGRIVALTGPIRKEAIPFRILLVDPQPALHMTPLFSMEIPKAEAQPQGAKAEAILPLEQADGSLRAFVLYDGLPNGGAHIVRLSGQ